MNLRFSFTKASLALLLFVLCLPALAQTHTMPGKTQVTCNGCLGLNAHSEVNDGKPTVAYGDPLTRHVGRLVDSANTESMQCFACRTVRAGKILIARTRRGNAPPRAYIQMGEAVAAYNLDTFFSVKLPAGPESVNKWVTGGRYSRRAGMPFETVIVPDSYVNPEADRGTGGWTEGSAGDDQYIYGDHDYDDRGYVYATFSVYGWGIVKDSGESGGAKLPLVKQVYDVGSTTSVEPEVIVVLKSGSKYYALISPRSANAVAIYDVTNPAAPVKTTFREGKPWGIKKSERVGLAGWAKDSTGRLAFIGGDGRVRIFEPADFVAGGTPLIEIRGKNTINHIAFDESDNLWIAEGTTGGATSNVLRKYTRSGSTYTETVYDSPYGSGAFSPLNMHVAEGHIVLAGWGKNADGGDALDLRLLKIEGTNVRNIDLGGYFMKYYHYAPNGFAQPQAKPANYVSIPRGVQIIEWGNKTYLMYNTFGMGDVYEISAGGSIAAQMKSTFGTPNPHAQGEPGPYYADTLTFNATSSAPFATSMDWDFGNPESGPTNSGNSANGADIKHQYIGLTTAGQITAAKTVTVSDHFDPTVMETLTVNLKVPKARIGLPGGTALSAVNTTGVNVVAGDFFTDASDGSVEGHFGTWTLDTVPTKFMPGTQIPVGLVGQHTMTLVGSYGRYDATSLLPSGTPFNSNSVSVTYDVRPFLFTFKTPAPSGTSNVRFGATARTAAASILTAPTWTVTWTLKQGANDLHPPQSGSAAVGTIPNYDVPKNLITSGSVLTLKLEVAQGGIVGPAAYLVYTDTMPLQAPDPKINKSGCTHALGACTFTATSLGADPAMTGWVYEWKVLQGTSVIASGTNSPTFTPTINTAGSYKVTLKVTKSIFEKAEELPFTAAAPQCGPIVPADQVSIFASCTTNCPTDTDITFRADVFQYSVQDCDEFLWNFGDGTTGASQFTTHKFAINNSYTVKLTVKNATGSSIINPIVVRVGSSEPPPPPPPTCDAPTSASFTWSGNKGCRPGIDCKTGESVRFTAKKNDATLQDCDVASWSFGDDSGSPLKSPSHTYSAAGTFSVTLNVTNTKGSAPTVTQALKVVEDTTGNCTLFATKDDLILYYVGRDSGCSYANDVKCKKNEVIDFKALAFGYTFQSCDKYTWSFGDSGTSSTKEPTHSYTAAGNAFEVSLKVHNTANPSGATVTKIITFEGAPAEPVPTLTLPGFPRNGSKGATISFTVESDIDTTTGWTWDFGDGSGKNTSQAGQTGKTNTITHTFAAAGQYTVTVQARNGKDPSTVLTAAASNQITIVDIPTWNYLLPVSIHANGDGGSVWRTDVQIYHSTASPATPLKMTATFQGQNYNLELTQSTYIYDDFIGVLLGPDKSGQGSVLISTQNPVAPQIWTRTYNLAANGGTFGQFIPAILLNPVGGSGSATPAKPKYYLAGIREDARFRTNVGFVNLNTTDIAVNVAVYDEVRRPIGSFPLTIPAYTVQQFPLGTKLANLPAKPLSLDIDVPEGKQLFAYASLIDRTSNDPVLITAVADGDAASEDFRTSVTPGVGRIGDWRSDVTIFNPDTQGVDIDLEFYDSAGNKQGEAKGIFIGPLQFIQYEDLLRANVLTPTPPDSVGSLKIKTNTPANFTTNRFPVSFSRTYNDKNNGTGTFGQGINGFGAARANVKPGKTSLIPAVRSDDSYYTNIGLTNVSSVAVTVKVTLLDPNTGQPSAQQGSYTLAPNQSVVGTFDFGGNYKRGTLKVEIVGSEGAVWAFCSVIDRKTADPEYVPATLLP